MPEVAGDLGLAKLWLIRRVLALRRREPDRFAGPYAPLASTGPHAERVFAFARGDALAVAVPIRGEPDPGAALVLPAGRWRDVLDDSHDPVAGRVAVGELWRRFPVAVLAKI